MNMRSNEVSIRQPVLSANPGSDVAPVTRPISNVHLIPAVTSNPPPPQDPPFIRQNYATDVEAALNKQINIELHASYVYLSMSYYCDRGDVGLPNTAKWLKKRSDEKREHAQIFMKYQNTRGGKIVFQNIQKPEVDEWGSVFESFQAALALEKFINNILLELHSLASQRNDPQMCSFLQKEFLTHQQEIIKKTSEIVFSLKRLDSGLGEFTFDRLYFKD